MQFTRIAQVVNGRFSIACIANNCTSDCDQHPAPNRHHWRRHSFNAPKLPDNNLHFRRASHDWSPAHEWSYTRYSRQRSSTELPPHPHGSRNNESVSSWDGQTPSTRLPPNPPAQWPARAQTQSLWQDNSVIEEEEEQDRGNQQLSDDSYEAGYIQEEDDVYTDTASPKRHANVSSSNSSISKA